MKNYDISQLPIMDGNEIVGTISENSILQHILENPLVNAEKAASNIMTEPMPSVSMDLPLSLLNKSFTEKVPGVITKDQNGQFHVITKYDIIQAI
jgi:cystathionine beta-synthase